MKRCLVLFVSLLMLFNVILPLSATTSGNEVWVSSATGKPGETINIKVSLGHFRGISSLKLSVEFDDANISLIDIKYSDDLPGDTLLPETFGNPATLNWYNTNNFNGNCGFATLTFKIKDTAHIGEYNINLGVYQKDTLGYTTDGELVRYEFPYVYPGKITVESDKSNYIEVSDVLLDKTSVSLDIDDTIIIRPTVIPENATNSAVVWYSSNNNIATVDTNGKVTAISSGKATITAVSENASASCKVVVNKPHVHAYIEMIPNNLFIASNSSCTERATYYYSCSCGLCGTNLFEYGAYDSHSFSEWQTITEPTETTTGLKERICTTCTIAKETRIIPVIGHVHNYDKMIATPEHMVAGATCEKQSIFYYSCECGENGSSTFVYGGYSSHVLTKHIAVDSSCELDGNIQYYECEVCGKLFVDDFATTEITVSDTILPAKGHEYADSWSWDSVDHWYECTVCGNKDNKDAHIPGAPATETTDQVCTECNYIITPALGHTHDYNSAWLSNESGHWKKCVCEAISTIEVHIPGAPATETTDQVCTECNYIITPALGHTHDYNSVWLSNESGHWKKCVCEDSTEIIPHTPNIPESTTEQEKVCTECGYVMEEKKHSHTPKTLYGYGSTCSKTGLTDGSECSECGEILVAQQVIPKLPHIAGEKVIANIVLAKPYHLGSFDFVSYCEKCGEVAYRQTVIVPYSNPLVPGKPVTPEKPEEAHVHTYKDIIGYDSDCVNAGLTSGSVCADCGTVLVAQEIIPAKGHICGDFLTENKVEATAKTDGSYDIVCYCTVCGEELARVDVVIPATDGIENPETSDEGISSTVMVLPIGFIAFITAAVLVVKKLFSVK